MALAWGTESRWKNPSADLPITGEAKKEAEEQSGNTSSVLGGSTEVKGGSGVSSARGLSFYELTGESSLETGVDDFPAMAPLSWDESRGEIAYSNSISKKVPPADQEISYAVASASSGEPFSVGVKKVNDSVPLETAQTRRVIVREGDSLAKIIIAAYGKFDQKLLQTVLQLNPHITDPNLLLVGQVIELPTIGAKKAF